MTADLRRRQQIQARPTHLKGRLGQVIAAGVMLILLSPLTSHAQTLQDLRQENQRLKDQIRDLTAQLETANAQVAELLDRIDHLEKTIAAKPNGQQEDEQLDSETSPADQQPLPNTSTQQAESPDALDEATLKAAGAQASPTALLYALHESYQQDVGILPTGAPGSATNLSYLRSVRLWLRQVNHTYRAHVNWTVRIKSRETEGRKTEVKIQPLLEDSLTAIGHPFWIRLNASQDGRLNTILKRSRSDLIRLEGALIPAAQFDPQVIPEIAKFQISVTHSERPPVIGPYVSFYYFFQPTRIYPFTPAQDATTAPEVSEEAQETPTENDEPKS